MSKETERARERSVLDYYFGMRDLLLIQRPELKDLPYSEYEAEMRRILNQVVSDSGFMTPEEIDFIFDYLR